MQSLAKVIHVVVSLVLWSSYFCLSNPSEQVLGIFNRNGNNLCMLLKASMLDAQFQTHKQFSL
jgi:hypothetical protein